MDSYSVHLIIWNHKTFFTFAVLLVKDKEFCFANRGFQQTLTESDEENCTRKENDLLEPLILFWMSTCLV